MKHVGWMVVVLVLLLGLIANSPAYPNSPEPKIVFLRYTHEPSDEQVDFVTYPMDAWVAGIDGKNSTKITSSRAVEFAAWLDANTIAVISQSDIWLIQFKDSVKKATRLTRVRDVQTLSCSPKGEQIVFIRSVFLKNRLIGTWLCSIKRDGSDYRVLNKEWMSANDIGPDFADNITMSNDMVFSNWCSGKSDWANAIKMVDIEGKGGKLVYKCDSEQFEISGLISSKNGQRLIFTLLGEYGVFERIYLKEMDMQDLKQRTLFKLEGGKYGYVCSFMPSEQQILLSGYEAGSERTDIFVLDLKPGAKPKLLIRNACAADVWYPGK